MFALQYVSPSIRYPPEWINDPKAENPKIEQVFIPLHETWNGIEELVNIHKITKHIGVYNFNVQLLSLFESKEFSGVLSNERYIIY